jgi:hypothetical protein
MRCSQPDLDRLCSSSRANAGGGAPGVAQAVVVGREDQAGAGRLVGYVVAADGAEVTAAALRAHLRQRLPDAMVPSQLVTLAALPLTTGGAVDRAALPVPDAGPLETDHVAPRTPTENERAIRQVLRTTQRGSLPTQVRPAHR